MLKMEDELRVTLGSFWSPDFRQSTSVTYSTAARKSTRSRPVPRSDPESDVPWL